MNRRVALLRGVNVGTAKRVAMADLRELFGELGYTDVRTLLNSGNVVYSGAAQGRDEARRIEQAIADRLGVSTRVTVVSRKALAAALRDNPLPAAADDPSRTLLLVLRDAKAVAALKPLLAERWAPEVLMPGKGVAYLWCAKGIADGRLWTTVNRVVGEGGTARNVTTMQKLLALVEGDT